MEKTKAVARAVQQDFNLLLKQKRNQLNRWFSNQSDKLAVAIMRWLIERRSTQKVVADTFSSDTPMCRVLRVAIEDGIQQAEDRQVDADDVQHLDTVIEREVDEKLQNIADERWFTDAIADAIDTDKIAEEMGDNEELINAIAKRVVETLVERLQQ